MIAEYPDVQLPALDVLLDDRGRTDARVDERDALGELLVGRAEQAAGREFDRKGWHARTLALGPLGLDRLAVELARA